MSNEMTTAMKSAKTIQSEMVQWENRLEHAKSEGGNLKRQNEILEQEIIAKRTSYEAYIASRDAQLRQDAEKLLQDRKIFDAQYAEFKDALDKHLKERAQLAQEKSDFAKEKSRVEGIRSCTEEFIQAVRRAYNVLPG